MAAAVCLAHNVVVSLPILDVRNGTEQSIHSLLGLYTSLYCPESWTQEVPFPHHTPHSSRCAIPYSSPSHPTGTHSPSIHTPWEGARSGWAWSTMEWAWSTGVIHGAPSGSCAFVNSRISPLGRQWCLHGSSLNQKMYSVSGFGREEGG